MKIMNKKVNRVEKLTSRLQRNLSIFNSMIANIKALNEEIDSEIAMVDDEIAAKQQEKETMQGIKLQNDKIKSNFEALLQ